MNDDRLVELLRASAALPVSPPPGSADRVWEQMQRRRPTDIRRLHRTLLVAAALLVLAAIAISMGAGRALDRTDNPLAGPVASPSSRSSVTSPVASAAAASVARVPWRDTSFVGEMEVEMVSTIDEIAAYVTTLDPFLIGLSGEWAEIVAVRGVAGPITFPDGEGMLTSSAGPIWLVELRDSDGTATTLFVEDGEPSDLGSCPNPRVYPAQPSAYLWTAEECAELLQQ